MTNTKAATYDFSCFLCDIRLYSARDLLSMGRSVQDEEISSLLTGPCAGGGNASLNDSVLSLNPSLRIRFAYSFHPATVRR